MYIQVYIYIYIYFRKKSANKKENAQDEKKKRSYADVVNGTHFNNIRVKRTILLKLTLLRLTLGPILLKV